MTPVHAHLSHTYSFNHIHFTYTKQFYTYKLVLTTLTTKVQLMHNLHQLLPTPWIPPTSKHTVNANCSPLKRSSPNSEQRQPQQNITTQGQKDGLNYRRVANDVAGCHTWR